MSTSTPTAAVSPIPAAMQEFLRTTSRVGMLTMLAGLLLSLAGPAYLYFFTDLGITVGEVATAYTAVALVFGVLWIVEPISYFPVLGSSAMYQAFLIGNISSKLLPAAVVAQDAVKAKPGTPRGDIAAVMAICGAATVHLTSLFVFVGLLGTWLVSALPQDVMLVVSTYIAPAVLGAVFVQAIMSYRVPRTTLIAVGVGILVILLVVPQVAALKFLGVPLTVVLTVLIAYLARPRTPAPAAADDVELHY